MKHIITLHFVNDKNKEGVPFKTKKGEPFSKVTIKVAVDPKIPQEYDEKYISGLSFNPTDASRSWEIGDEVEINVEKNNEFWNFKTPNKVDSLESRVKALEDFMKNGGEKSEKIDLPELTQKSGEVEEDSIPF